MSEKLKRLKECLSKETAQKKEGEKEKEKGKKRSESEKKKRGRQIVRKCGRITDVMDKIEELQERKKTKQWEFGSL